MALILATDPAAAAAALPALLAGWQPGAGVAPAVLLHGGGAAGQVGALEAALRPLLPELVAVEAGSPRAARLNYGALALLAVDLPAEALNTAAARRLFDALHGLMAEGLSLLLVGAATALAGSLALAPDAGEPPLGPGLGLLPGALVLPALGDAAALHEPLLLLRAVRGRLLALAGPAALRCDARPQGMRFTLHGAGSALLAAFVEGSDPEQPSVRLLPLQHGHEGGWPNAAG